MSRSTIKSLKRTALIKTLLSRVSAINAADENAVPDLYSYKANRLARSLHPHIQFLKVKEVIEHGADMKSFILAPDPENGTEKLAWFSAGQYISVALDVDGATLCRPYSLASSPRDALNGCYRITVKRVDGGLASQYMLDRFSVGTEVIASAPLGDFTYEPLRDAKNIVGIAGGSGITPFRSLAKAIKEGDENCSLTLLYGSRTLKDAVFSDEIADWAKDCDKIKLVNVLSEETVEGYEHGFVTADLIKKYAPQGEYSLFLCGPQAMYAAVDREIGKLGIRRKFVRHELFGEYFHPEKNADYRGDVTAEYVATVHCNGEIKKIPCRADTSLLRSMEGAGIRVPSDCRSGRCGWCHSLLLSGEVYIPESVDGRRMADEEYGYIHPCCAFPLSDVEIDVPILK